MSNLSLKGFIPELAEAVGMTPAALYERQRALVRAGLLHSESGRGPGSGVRATPESVAMLLIALLATESLSETESQAKTIGDLKTVKKPCPLTGKKTFASALAAALASEDTAKRIRWIEVERGGAMAEAAIVYWPRGSERIGLVALEMLSDQPQQAESQFGVLNASRKSPLRVRISLALPFQEIARGLKETTK